MSMGSNRCEICLKEVKELTTCHLCGMLAIIRSHPEIFQETVIDRLIPIERDLEEIRESLREIKLMLKINKIKKVTA